MPRSTSGRYNLADELATFTQSTKSPATVLELTGKTAPRTGLEAKFSVLFACAIALLDGTAGEQQFSDANVVRSDVRALMSRITLVPSESLNHSQAIATARTSVSREVTVSIEHATGTPDNRIDDSDLVAKFHLLVDPVLGSRQAEELEALVWQVTEPTSWMRSWTRPCHPLPETAAQRAMSRT